jgi:phosphatidate cytidylyltransferase
VNAASAAPANNSWKTEHALLTRILTALPLIAGFLIALFLAPGPVWTGIMALALFLAGMEWAGLARQGKAMGVLYGGALTLAGVAAALYVVDFSWAYTASLAFWLVAAAWLLRRGVTFTSMPLLLALGALVLLPTFFAIIQLRAQSPGLLLAVVGLVVIADSAAYFSGRRFGRHKLAPRISPGKTWEGVAGAWLGVSVYALLLARTWPDALAVSWLMALSMAWALLLLSVLGDLMESFIKRQAGVKDSGTLLPGHGGVLDRIDSLTAALPAATLFALYMQ